MIGDKWGGNGGQLNNNNNDDDNKALQFNIKFFKLKQKQENAQNKNPGSREMWSEAVFSEERSLRACTEIRREWAVFIFFFFFKCPSLYFAWQRRTEDLPVGQQGKHQEVTVLAEGRDSSRMGRSWALTLALQAHRTEHWPETG